MSDNPELVELSTMSTEQAFLTLFQTDDAIPPRLYEPARSLALAQDTTRCAEARTMDLGQMSRDTDAIFRNYLSPLSVVGNQPQQVSTSWPIALARWTELLHYHANELLVSDILPDLARDGFHVLSVSDVPDECAEWIHAHFQQHLYPLLTPLAVDPGRPFPYISSDSLNLLVELRGGVRHEPAILLARVKIPIITPRLIRVPATCAEPMPAGVSHSPATHIWSIDLVRHYVTELFVDMPIRSVHCFRVLRAPGAVDPAQQEDDRQAEVHGRTARGSVVRVDVESAMPADLFDWLVDHLDVISYSVVRYDAPAAVMSLPQLADAVQRWAQDA